MSENPYEQIGEQLLELCDEIAALKISEQNPILYKFQQAMISHAKKYRESKEKHNELHK